MEPKTILKKEYPSGASTGIWEDFDGIKSAIAKIRNAYQISNVSYASAYNFKTPKKQIGYVLTSPNGVVLATLMIEGAKRHYKSCLEIKVDSNEDTFDAVEVRSILSQIKNQTLHLNLKWD